jgi:hypothetical protein
MVLFNTPAGAAKALLACNAKMMEAVRQIMRMAKLPV